MKFVKLLFIVILVVFVVTPVQAWRKWEHTNPSDIEIRIRPNTPEVVSGEIATFTISIRNRTDKTVKMFYPTGQRWDLAVFHYKTQIYRWSQGYMWEEAPHTVPIRAGNTLSYELSWRAVDRLDRPLPKGVYHAQGMVMTKPRYLVSNKCSIRLVPAVVKKQKVVKTNIGKYFNIKLPRYSGVDELTWKIVYVRNDNRLKINSIKKEGKNTTLVFQAKRRGYVIVHLYAHYARKRVDEAIERRTFRVEVK